MPLLIGSYVSAEIHGMTIDDAIVIPRRALREVHTEGSGGAREGLWIMDGDDRLAIREAEVIWRGEETVIVSSGSGETSTQSRPGEALTQRRPGGAPIQHLVDGDRLVTSTISTPIEGMKLAVAHSAAGVSAPNRADS